MLQKAHSINKNAGNLRCGTAKPAPKQIRGPKHKHNSGWTGLTPKFCELFETPFPALGARQKLANTCHQTTTNWPNTSKYANHNFYCKKWWHQDHFGMHRINHLGTQGLQDRYSFWNTSGILYGSFPHVSYVSTPLPALPCQHSATCWILEDIVRLVCLLGRLHWCSQFGLVGSCSPQPSSDRFGSYLRRWYLHATCHFVLKVRMRNTAEWLRRPGGWSWCASSFLVFGSVCWQIALVAARLWTGVAKMVARALPTESDTKPLNWKLKPGNRKMKPVDRKQNPVN